jgi:hypothetical protein
MLAVKIVIGILVFLLIMRAGIWLLRGISRPLPVPEEGELRRVNIKFRCTICGAEVKMTRAGEELPEPPRHCMEDMQLVAPVE